MDATLSSLIAFVGFLIVFSMLIQSVQEALKNLFKLKTGVWERFFITLYETDFKTKERLHSTPFWRRVTFGKFVGEFDERLKRLGAVVVRTDDLLKDMKKVLSALLASEKNLSSKDPDVLKQIEELSQFADQVSGLKIDAMIRLYDISKKGKISGLLEEFKEATVCLDRNQANGCDNLLPFCQILFDITRKLEKSLATYRVQIETKADAWLVQLQGEYKKNMLKWTLVISVAAVCLMNADSFTIYKHFTVTPAARKDMEAAAGSAEKPSLDRSDELNQVLKDIRAGQLSDAKPRMQLLAVDVSHQYAVVRDDDGLKEAQTLQENINSIMLDSEQTKTELMAQYGVLTSLYVMLQPKQAAFQKSILDEAGLPLGWLADWRQIHPAPSQWNPFLILKKICGLTLTIFLVSFGAPFWKNVMNALIGLRQMTRAPVKKTAEKMSDGQG